MALIPKYDYITEFSGSSFAILNENSNVNFNDVQINNITPTFNINNSSINILSSSFINNILTGNITINNSNSYIDDLRFNNRTHSFTENGSLFNYVDEISESVGWVVNSIKEQLLIPSSLDVCNSSKTEYIRNANQIKNFGTGNQYFSTHYITNKIYGYWGERYAGQFISDCVIDDISSMMDFTKVLNTIPRNLNGYTVTIIAKNGYYAAENVDSLNISNFYNGKLNIYLKDVTISNFKFNIINNNANILLSASHLDSVNLNMEDNQDINLLFGHTHLNDQNEEVEAGGLTDVSFTGNNNNLNLKFNLMYNLTFFNKSFSNKVIIDTLPGNFEILNSLLHNNNVYNGNYYFIKGLDAAVGDLVNDGSDVFDRRYNEQFVINEVHPLVNRDISDIGTIVGWNAELPIPRGYYVCSGQTISIDIHNSEDEFYNGQLAYYLNKDLNNSTMTLPNIPEAVPSAMSTDPNIKNIINFIPKDPEAKLIYIIKYNNNFENKRD